jgi:hypothetical protein
MGWRKPPDAVIAPHPTGWANPYNVAEYGQAGAAARRELAGKTLACCCPPDLPCHADVPPTSGTNTKGPNPVQRRCNATAAPPASPAATRHGRRAPLQDARRIRIQPSSPTGHRPARARGSDARICRRHDGRAAGLPRRPRRARAHACRLRFEWGLRSSPDSA